MGITPAGVQCGLFENISLSNSATASIDSESDTSVGTGNVTLENVYYDSRVDVVQRLIGPFYYLHQNWAREDRWWVGASGYPITFDHSSLHCAPHAPGACIRDSGGNVTVSNDDIAYGAGVQPDTELVYEAINGAHLTFQSTPSLPPRVVHLATLTRPRASRSGSP